MRVPCAYDILVALMARTALRHMIPAWDAWCDLNEQMLGWVLSRRVGSHTTDTVLMTARPRRDVLRMCR